MRQLVEGQADEAQLARTLRHEIGRATGLHEMGAPADAGRHLAAGDADRIRVHVREGSVTLTGTVRSWAEGQAVIEAVRRARGVQAIDNRLRINPNV